MSADAMRDLRPMSIGELLDRAFTISFKHIVPFMAIVFVVVVPELVLNFFALNGPMSKLTDQLLKSPVAVPGSTAPPVDPTAVLSAYAAAAPYFTALFAYAIVIVPLANAAIVSGVSRAYLGVPVRFVDCYHDAVRQWGSLVFLGLLWIATAFGAALVGGITFGIVVALLSGIGVLLGTAGAIIAIVVAIALGLVILAFSLQLYLSAAFSFVAVVLERMSAPFAFRSGFRRVFAEGNFWRSLGIAAALFGILIGFEIISFVLASLAVAELHSPALQSVITGLITAFTYPFLFAVVAVSYYDVRIRREGFDLQLLAANLTSPAPGGARLP